MAASVANRETATPRDFHQAAAKFGKVEEKHFLARVWSVKDDFM